MVFDSTTGVAKIVGDLNGDGYDDAVIGVPTFNNNSGAVYVVWADRLRRAGSPSTTCARAAAGSPSSRASRARSSASRSRAATSTATG